MTMIRGDYDRVDSLKFELSQFKEDFVEFVKKTEKRFDKLYTLVDGFAGDYKKINEEQDLLSGRVSNHSDRLEKVEEKIFGVAGA